MHSNNKSLCYEGLAPLHSPSDDSQSGAGTGRDNISKYTQTSHSSARKIVSEKEGTLLLTNSLIATIDAHIRVNQRYLKRLPADDDEVYTVHNEIREQRLLQRSHEATARTL